MTEPAERNDGRFVDDASIMLAVYADAHGLTLEEGRALAERAGEAMENGADDREAYLPAEGLEP